MDLATGPLPSRAPMMAAAERRADPWGDFLRRVLVSVGPTSKVQTPAVGPLGAAPPRPVPLSESRTGLPAG